MTTPHSSDWDEERPPPREHHPVREDHLPTETFLKKKPTNFALECLFETWTGGWRVVCILGGVSGVIISSIEPNVQSFFFLCRSSGFLFTRGWCEDSYCQHSVVSLDWIRAVVPI
eukprot:TRINITY_DN7373_c0_g1_i1.p2 TRINITY_DN7373_c0_g1~~TRINITY_DN7373_c0_g1_i1.p2  ORF type:complete len:127 (-),score=33.81 TRINITY_DN7373_c0_g1_i1:646-990(-)